MAISPHIWLAGLLTSGGVTALYFPALAASEKVADSVLVKENPLVLPTKKDQLTPPAELKLKADRQTYDIRQKLFIAEGQVKVFFNGSILQADRIEFDNQFKTLFARGSVRYKNRYQYLQASTFRYSFIQNEGELKDVYGVIELKDLTNEVKPRSVEEKKSNLTKQTRSSSAKKPTNGFLENALPPLNSWLYPANKSPLLEIIRKGKFDSDRIACPPALPPIPDWRPSPWAFTVWGGQMIDSKFGETFLFEGQSRQEYLIGLGIGKRIYRNGPIEIELEADIFRHAATKQAGGGFNQSVPFADTSAQNFLEGVLGVGLRLWLRPWLSVAVIEGVSYNDSSSNYEKTYRDKYAKFLNYLSFEIEAAIAKKLSLVGRIHHRSGVYGTFGGAEEGSNAYLLGLRMRWGEDEKPQKIALPAPLGCDFQNKRSEQIISLPSSFYQNSSPSIQESNRKALISKIDQRISNVKFDDGVKIQAKVGSSRSVRNDGIGNQFSRLQSNRFITGSITRWRIQASKVIVNSSGWKADRVSFSNDPFTPTQTRIDAKDVVIREDENGDILIESASNKLIVEERLSFPVTRKKKIKREEVENRWVLGVDEKDRDGFYIGRNMKPFAIGDRYTLSLQPQFLVQRFLKGKTNSYLKKGDSAKSKKSNQKINFSDWLGLKAELGGSTFGWDVMINANISTWNTNRFADGSRYWSRIKKAFDFPILNEVDINLFGAYRYRAWNGSLGETDIYSAYGAFLEKKGSWKWSKLSNSYLLRLGAGNYRAEEFGEGNLASLWRTNFYGVINSSYPIWIGSKADLTHNYAFRYSPRAIVPGLTLNSRIRSIYSAYGDGKSLNTISFSAGPTLVLGTFSKPYLDYTKVSIFAGATIKQGSSPFDFDEAIDLKTLGIDFTQQIAGPLLINTGLELNIDKESKYFAKATNSKVELIWQRRSYDFTLYYRPYERVGGFKVNLNNFNFDGPGLPFMPYKFDHQDIHLDDQIMP